MDFEGLNEGCLLRNGPGVEFLAAVGCHPAVGRPVVETGEYVGVESSLFPVLLGLREVRLIGVANVGTRDFFILLELGAVVLEVVGAILAVVGV